MNTVATAAPRFPPDQVKKHYNVVSRHSELLSVLQAVPQIAFVLNSSRQVVYGNSVLLEQLGMSRIDEALGSRPGEIMQCIHAHGGNCGDAEGCRYCGAVLAIMESQRTLKSVTREARITVRQEGDTTPLELSVTASPLLLASTPFTMVFITDISAQNRRDYLEQIFFHDLLNTINGLSMVTSLLNMREIPENLQSDFRDITFFVKMITEDIRGHQLLLSAEKGEIELEVTPEPINTLIEKSLDLVKFLLTDSGLSVEYKKPSPTLCVMTDQRLARRVIVNAFKNAVEASSPGEKIKISTMTTLEGCTILVHNQKPIPEEVQHQIFQRSFSTKGTGRGLGTYSMRLLLERYLGGQVSFKTSPEKGTIFLITLPHSCESNPLEHPAPIT